MFRKRPVVNIPTSPIEKISDILSLFVVAATIGVVLLNWQKLPDQIPTHFDITGAANNYGPKSTLIFLTGLSIANFLMTTILRRYPQSFNYIKRITEANAAAQYSLARKFMAVVKLETCGILFYAIWICVQTGLTGASSINMVPLFCLLGALMLSGVSYSIAAMRAP